MKLWSSAISFRRLIDYVCFASSCGIEFAERSWVQDNDLFGQLQRGLGPTTAMNVPIEIGAGKGDHDGGVRMFFPKPIDGRVTAPSMQRDQQIIIFIMVLLSDRHPM